MWCMAGTTPTRTTCTTRLRYAISVSINTVIIGDLAYKKWLVGQLKVHVHKRKKGAMEEVEMPDPKDIQPGYLQMHTMVSLTDDYTSDNS